MRSGRHQTWRFQRPHHVKQARAAEEQDPEDPQGHVRELEERADAGPEPQPDFHHRAGFFRRHAPAHQPELE